MLNKLALGCPDCGLFVRGVDILTAMRLLSQHPTAFLCFEEEYMRRCHEVFAEAEQAVTT